MRGVDSPLDLSIFGPGSPRPRPPSPESGSSGTRSENTTPMATPAPTAAASAKSKSVNWQTDATRLVPGGLAHLDNGTRSLRRRRRAALRGYAEVKRREAQNAMAIIELERFKLESELETKRLEVEQFEYGGFGQRLNDFVHHPSDHQTTIVSVRSRLLRVSY
ncbi:hypothetical protein V1506DRAFT_525054 [Lipomyces tetrasporus]